MFLGEAFEGQIPNNAHPNVALGKREVMFPIIAHALAHPTRDLVSSLVVLKPNVMVKPATLFANKMAVDTPNLARMTWGPAQAGVALGVHDAMAEGILPPEAIEDWMIIAAVWVNPHADDSEAVERNNRSAIKAAIAQALTGIPRAVLDAAAAAPSNPFHGGEAAGVKFL